MKFCAVQLKPVAGDVKRNTALHVKFIEEAASWQADFVFFPELSLTGYEPHLADVIAVTPSDAILDVFQNISRNKRIIIAIGAPVKAATGVQISLLIFQPDGSRLTYSKQFLHDDELPFFVAGETKLFIACQDDIIAPAICYESLLPHHAEVAFNNGATVYLASVAKSASGLQKAVAHYPAIAKKYGFGIIMANAIGYCDNFFSAGGTAAWDREGKLVNQLNNESEGLLFFDTKTGVSSARNGVTTGPDNLIK